MPWTDRNRTRNVPKILFLAIGASLLAAGTVYYRWSQSHSPETRAEEQKRLARVDASRVQLASVDAEYRALAANNKLTEPSQLAGARLAISDVERAVASKDLSRAETELARAACLQDSGVRLLDEQLGGLRARLLERLTSVEALENEIAQAERALSLRHWERSLRAHRSARDQRVTADQEERARLAKLLETDRQDIELVEDVLRLLQGSAQEGPNARQSTLSGVRSLLEAKQYVAAADALSATEQRATLRRDFCSRAANLVAKRRVITGVMSSFPSAEGIDPLAQTRRLIAEADRALVLWKADGADGSLLRASQLLQATRETWQKRERWVSANAGVEAFGTFSSQLMIVTELHRAAREADACLEAGDTARASEGYDRAAGKLAEIRTALEAHQRCDEVIKTVMSLGAFASELRVFKKIKAAVAEIDSSLAAGDAISATQSYEHATKSLIQICEAMEQRGLCERGFQQIDRYGPVVQQLKVVQGLQNATKQADEKLVGGEVAAASGSYSQLVRRLMQTQAGLEKRESVQTTLHNMPAVGRVAAGITEVKNGKQLLERLLLAGDAKLSEGNATEAIALYDELAAAANKLRETACKELLALSKTAKGETRNVDGAMKELLEMDEAFAMQNVTDEVAVDVGMSFLQGADGLPKDGTRAVRWISNAAARGGALATFALGNCYESGTGVTKNDHKAFDLYKKAAEQGHLGAQWHLGMCYRDGVGVAQDVRAAARWFKSAAEQDHTEAQFALGNCFVAGKDYRRFNWDEAALWYGKAAAKRHAGAQYALAQCYQYGHGVPFNEREAAVLYRKSAEQGHAAAQRALGFCYVNGAGAPESWEKAVIWFRKAAEQGDVETQFTLAKCFVEGTGVPKDLGQAMSWYLKAAQQGHSSAQKELADCYAYGVGGQQDWAKAAEWYSRAAQQGIAEAQAKFAECLLMGRGVRMNYGDAISWYEKAAKSLECSGFLGLGVCYENGLGVQRNISTAVENYGNALAYSRQSPEVARKAEQALIRLLPRDRAQERIAAEKPSPASNGPNLMLPRFKQRYELDP